MHGRQHAQIGFRHNNCVRQKHLRTRRHVRYLRGTLCTHWDALRNLVFLEAWCRNIWVRTRSEKCTIRHVYWHHEVNTVHFWRSTWTLWKLHVCGRKATCPTPSSPATRRTIYHQEGDIKRSNPLTLSHLVHSCAQFSKKITLQSRSLTTVTHSRLTQTLAFYHQRIVTHESITRFYLWVTGQWALILLPFPERHPNFHQGKGYWCT